MHARPGSYVITGSPAILNADRFFNLAPGSYLIQGYPLSFFVGELPPWLTASDLQVRASEAVDLLVTVSEAGEITVRLSESSDLKVRP